MFSHEHRVAAAVKLVGFYLCWIAFIDKSKIQISVVEKEDVGL